MNRRPLLNALCLVCLSIPAATSAAPVQEWMARGNAFYEEGRFDSAATYYRKVVESGMRHSAVYYNLGNACFRLGDPGLAILWYERAHALAPNDPDITANLKFARVQLTDRIPEPERTFLETVLRGFHTLLPLHTQLWILLGLFAVLSALFSAALFASHNLRLWLIYLLSLGGLLCLVLGFSTGYKIYRNEHVSYAIVLEDRVDAVSEPKGTKVLFSVHEGTKFRIHRKIDSWALVSLPNGVSGWVKRETMEEI